jgi:hypothetical protein
MLTSELIDVMRLGARIIKHSNDTCQILLPGHDFADCGRPLEIRVRRTGSTIIRRICPRIGTN